MRGAPVGPGFEEFVETRSMSLFRTAYLVTGSRQSAEDVLQSALEKAYPRWGRIRRMDSPEAYVRRMVVTQAADLYRKRKVVEVELGEGFEPAPQGADVWTLTDDRMHLVALLYTLPERMRTVLVLRYWEDMSESVVAEALGCSVGTVKAQASRGLARLRKVMKPELATAAGRGRELQ